MRLKLLIAATLAASCTDDSGDCPPAPDDTPFTFDEDLDEGTVHDLLAGKNISFPVNLNCQDVCDARYFADDAKRGFHITSITACELKLANEFTGKDDAILGSVHCEGYESDYFCRGGRRPLGHIDLPLTDNRLPAYLAHCAHIEAASVLAFTQLAERLTTWHAPADLISRCHQAACEEATHAELLAALTHEPVAPPCQHDIPVDLAAAALDNAIEGCVNEAWSALACATSARRAATPELRAVYTRLAADEAGHAQLAWDLHTWFMGQVSTSQRAAILVAQATALAGLPALARLQSRRAPPALALPDHRAAAHCAAALARAA